MCKQRCIFGVIFFCPYCFSTSFTIDKRHWYASFSPDLEIIRHTRILHARTKYDNIFLSSSLIRSQVIVVAYIRMKVFHWSAVNPENPSPVAILFGILPISDGTFILLARSCIIAKFFIVNRFSSIHNRVTIHFAMPKNRQCMGSTIRNWVGSKYGSRYISDYRTKVSET